jgi:hypothetical protein
MGKLANDSQIYFKSRWSHFTSAGVSDSPTTEKRLQGPFLSHLEAFPNLGKSRP